MVWQIRLQSKLMINSKSKFCWILPIHWYHNDLILRFSNQIFRITTDCSHLYCLHDKLISEWSYPAFLAIEFIRIITDCNYLYCLHDKSSLDKNIFFSLVKNILEKISFEKFTLEPAKQSAITIATKIREN